MSSAEEKDFRVISTARLRTLPSLHLLPIKAVVSRHPQGKPNLEAGFALRCFQRLSITERGYPAVQLALQPVHRRFVRPGPLVLGAGLRKFPAPATDRDRTVSRRSEPSSRATLMGEQPNPWDLLRPRDVTSRHRGAKPLRRFELSGAISLLSPEYLLSFERRTSREVPPDHFALLSHLFDLSVSQSSALLPICLRRGYHPRPGHLGKPPLLFRRRPPQSNYPPSGVPLFRVRSRANEGWYFNVDSASPEEKASQSPTYPTHRPTKTNAKLQ